MLSRSLLGLAVAAGLTAPAAAQPKDDLRHRLKDDYPAGDWVYDDLAAGFAQAKATGKPLLVVLRCVP